MGYIKAFVRSTNSRLVSTISRLVIFHNLCSVFRTMGMFNPWTFVCCVCFVALRPNLTAMVMAGRSVHLTTLFSCASLNKQINQTFACIVTDNTPSIMNESAEGRRMAIINLHESMGPGRDRPRDPWICSQTHICCQTRHRLRYADR